MMIPINFLGRKGCLARPNNPPKSTIIEASSCPYNTSPIVKVAPKLIKLILFKVMLTRPITPTKYKYFGRKRTSLIGIFLITIIRITMIKQRLLIMNKEKYKPVAVASVPLRSTMMEISKPFSIARYLYMLSPL